MFVGTLAQNGSRMGRDGLGMVPDTSGICVLLGPTSLSLGLPHISLSLTLSYPQGMAVLKHVHPYLVTISSGYPLRNHIAHALRKSDVGDPHLFLSMA